MSRPRRSRALWVCGRMPIPHRISTYTVDAGRLIDIAGGGSRAPSRESLAMKAASEVFYLYAARAARGFGDGFAAIILPAYLIEIGFNPFQVGVVAAAALLGSAALTLAIGFVGPGREPRTLLLARAAPFWPSRPRSRSRSASWRRAATCARCSWPARPSWC